jgi:hypothetical protein
MPNCINLTSKWFVTKLLSQVNESVWVRRWLETRYSFSLRLSWKRSTSKLCQTNHRRHWNPQSDSFQTPSHSKPSSFRVLISRSLFARLNRESWYMYMINRQEQKLISTNWHFRQCQISISSAVLLYMSMTLVIRSVYVKIGQNTSKNSESRSKFNMPFSLFNRFSVPFF